MTRERLEDIAKHNGWTGEEWQELVALARRGLEAEQPVEDLLKMNNTLRMGIAAHRAEIVALRRACELARDLIQDEYLKPHEMQNLREIIAALAAVGMPVEDE